MTESEVKTTNIKESNNTEHPEYSKKYKRKRLALDSWLAEHLVWITF